MPETQPSKSEARKHYFVDEAGDAVLFGSRGKVLIGSDGCSRFFMLGLLDVHDPERLATELAELRKNLLADPYFKGVPSMQTDEQKTALFFHAKDDLPEVRREVLKVLARHELHFSAVVKNKRRVLGYVQSRNDSDPAYRYRHDELYDHMLRRLFKQRLHTHDAYRVTFATRGHKDRTEALRLALEAARKRFAEEQGVSSRAAIEVVPATPPQAAGLQAVDYFLWALQRTYERREDRYLQLLWPQCQWVEDVDDTRASPHGAAYTKQKPLLAAALESVEGYRSD